MNHPTNFRVEAEWDGGGEYVTLPFFGHIDALAWAHMKYGNRPGLSLVITARGAA